MHKIMLVDDHPVVRLAVRVLLESHGYEVVGETDNGLDALLLARELLPDMVILDIRIPKLDGLQVIHRLQAMEEKIRVLVLTSLDANTIAPRCLQAGASGFVNKNGDLRDLSGAVNAVLSGYDVFPREAFGLAKNNGSEQDLLATLSDRELTVLQYLAVGMTNKQIADTMLLSNKTISTYKTRLQQKINATTMIDLLEFAKRNNVI